MKPATRRRVKGVIFRVLPSVVLGGLFLVWFRWYADPHRRGQDLNRLGWESTYTERGLPVPPDGPREGFWGKRLKKLKQHPDPRLGWYEPEASIPGLVEIDAHGCQHYSTASARKQRVLVHGASVAFGAYASGIATTYFHVLGTELERLQTPADVIVLATGMWRSAQELAALELQGCQEKPDVVVFLDGLNDIGLDSYRPYEDKIASYLANMRRAAEIASASDADLLIVLQPSLAERTRRTPVEETLLKHTLEPTHQSEETLRQFYAEARAGLKALAQRPRVRFFDASQLFEGEEATTFADLWHFSDFGHEILGRALARELAPLLKRRLEPAGRTVH